MSNNPFDPRNVSLLGVAPPHLIVCHISNCPHSVSISKPILPNIPWLTSLQCTNDTTHPPWSVCRLCPNTRIQYMTIIQIKKHNNNYHLSKIRNVTYSIPYFGHNKKRNIDRLNDFNDEDEFTDDNATCLANGFLEDVEKTQTEQQFSSDIKFNFSNTACNEFFTHQHNNGNGDSHLVSNACFNGEIHPLSINPKEKN